MDFDQIKSSIKEISDIAESVPERFREKCFEILLNSLLAGEKSATTENGGTGTIIRKEPSRAASAFTVTMNSQLRLLLKKTNLTEEELNKVVFVENGEVNFVQEPHPEKIRDGQLEWSLLMALKSAILRNALEADPEEIRSKCIDAGFYDKANFLGNFKAPKFQPLFKETLVSQGKPVALTPAGQEALGELIKRLAGAAK